MATESTEQILTATTDIVGSDLKEALQRDYSQKNDLVRKSGLCLKIDFSSSRKMINSLHFADSVSISFRLIGIITLSTNVGRVLNKTDLTKNHRV